MGDSEWAYVKEAFDQNWIAPVGPHINKFEANLSKIHLDYSVAALSSGTSAIHLALILLGVNSGDNVLCSSFTFSASVNPVKYLGANPIFIDSERESWNMCPELLEVAIKEGIAKNKKPKAIILVNLYGMPAKMTEIMGIANTYNIPVIEDNAEALGSTYKKQPLGTFGQFGVLSFNGNKIITTSGGGALISKNKLSVEKARYLATQARSDKPYYEHTDVGYNYRISNISAAIGIGQLDVLNQRIQRKREINQYYKKLLSPISEITFLEEYRDCFSNFWLTTILLDSHSKINNEYLRIKLEQENIESRPLWKPMHLQPVFKSCKSYLNNISEDLFNRGLCLPSGTNMTNLDIDRIVNIIKQAYEG